MPETTIATAFARRLTVGWGARAHGSDAFLIVEDTSGGDFIAARMSAEEASHLRDALSSALEPDWHFPARRPRARAWPYITTGPADLPPVAGAFCTPALEP